MGEISLFLLLPLISLIGISRIEADNPKNILEMFKKLSQEASVTDQDCNLKATKDTLRFLSGELSQNDMDCAQQKTNLDSLRLFLAKKGNFLEGHGGSLQFLNAQDHILKMRCSEIKDDKDDYRWQLEFSKQQDEFNFPVQYSKVLIIKSPPDLEYYRRYTCFRKTDAPDKRCRHVFHVITRPKPELNFPLQFAEDAEGVKITCKIPECFYKKCNPKASEPNPQTPYHFYWSFPEKMLINGTNETCMDAFEKEKPVVKQLVGFMKSSSSNEPESNGSKVLKPEFNNLKIELTGKSNVKGSDTIVSSTITIPKALVTHRGEYECVIIDANGVPSIPGRGDHLFDYKIHYTGHAEFHVRAHFYTYIPICIFFAILLIMAVIQSFCPLRMEYDDGTPYTKEQMVAPVEQMNDPNASTSTTEQVNAAENAKMTK